MKSIQVTTVNENVKTVNLPYKQILFVASDSMSFTEDAVKSVLDRLNEEHDLFNPKLTKSMYVNVVTTALRYSPLFNWHDAPIPVEITVHPDTIEVR